MASLAALGLLDTPAQDAFDELTELAAQVCGAPMALVSLIDEQRQWFKSSHGVQGWVQTPREDSFCAHTVWSGEIFEVTDTLLDERFVANPLVVGEPFVRFYAGAPLRSNDGHGLGELCVLDVSPRLLSNAQRRGLQILARQVMDQFEMRRQARLLATEVAARVASDAALAEQQRMLEAVLEHTDVLIYAKDLQGRFVMTSAALEQVTAVPGGLLGHTDHDLFGDDTALEYRRNDERIVATGQRQVFTEELMLPDGSTHIYRSTKFPLLDEDGSVLGVAGVSADVTELVASRVAEQQAEHRWRALIEQSPVAMFVVDHALRVIYLNPRAETLCALSAASLVEDGGFLADVIGVDADLQVLLATVVAGGDPLRGHHLHLDPGEESGATELVVEVNATRIHYQGIAALQVELRDVTDTIAARTELERHAHTDPLTGALNRRGWELRTTALSQGRRRSLVVALIDLDRFKVYNDCRGHDAGDQLLVQFVAIMQHILGEDGVLARWGGEEFVLALPDLSIEDAHRVLDRIRVNVPDEQSCSIGFTCWRPPEPLSTSVSRADVALFTAKERGRNQISVANHEKAHHLPEIIRTPHRPMGPGT